VPGRWYVGNNNEHRSRVVTVSATRARVRLGDPATPDLDFAGLSPASFHRFLRAADRPSVRSLRSPPRTPRRTGPALTIIALTLTVLATLAYFVAARPADPSLAQSADAAHLTRDLCQQLLNRTRPYPEALESLCQTPP